LTVYLRLTPLQTTDPAVGRLSPRLSRLTKDVDVYSLQDSRLAEIHLGAFVASIESGLDGDMMEKVSSLSAILWMSGRR